MCKYRHKFLGLTTSSFNCLGYHQEKKGSTDRPFFSSHSAQPATNPSVLSTLEGLPNHGQEMNQSNFDPCDGPHLAHTPHSVVSLTSLRVSCEKNSCFQNVSIHKLHKSIIEKKIFGHKKIGKILCKQTADVLGGSGLGEDSNA